MRDNDAIVRPVCNKKTPVLGSLAVMAASEDDLRALQNLLMLPDERRLYMSRIYYSAGNPDSPVLAGPMMGSPYAAMLLEILHAWGVREIVFLGWCGSIRDDVLTGDIIVPTGALIEEGTSPLYDRPAGTASPSNGVLRQQLQQLLRNRGLVFKEGLVWTTDGVFRETPDKVKAFSGKGALAVEMELSALLTVAGYHSIALSGLLAVSDELFSLYWRPGFKSAAFLKTRADLAEVLADWIKRKFS